MYTDTFFEPTKQTDGLRPATVKQVAALNMHAILTGGREKDWWDIDRLLDIYSLNQMFEFHKEWQPWTIPGKEEGG